MCDVSQENMAQTQALCLSAGKKVRVTTHLADVSIERQVIAFRDEVAQQHKTDHVDLLFNNAGIGGGGSFVRDDREEWDKTFDVCWGGVYYCSRAFIPLLLKSREAHLVNTSSVNGFWASLGPQSAHTAYSAAKFAVKGFSEALLNDFKLNAPHIKVSVVMPGHIGTSIVINSGKILGRDPKEMSDDQLAEARARMERGFGRRRDQRPAAPGAGHDRRGHRAGHADSPRCSTNRSRDCRRRAPGAGADHRWPGLARARLVLARVHRGRLRRKLHAARAGRGVVRSGPTDRTLMSRLSFLAYRRALGA
jgi:NAD(P)-dependent dehydrogenase (short-subunit alcohol dehydrogenase family)